MTAPAAYRLGRRLARAVFARKSNKTAVHLDELELALLLALAAQVATKSRHAKKGGTR